jgi:hypothetical protein
MFGGVKYLRHDIHTADECVSFLSVEGVEGVVVLDEGGLHLTVGLLLRPELLLVEELQHLIHWQAQVHYSHADAQYGLPRDAIPNLRIKNYLTEPP